MSVALVEVGVSPPRLGSIRFVLEKHFLLKSSLVGTQSPIGHQLSRARDGLFGSNLSGRAFEESWARYVATAKLLANLSDLEYDLVRIKTCGFEGHAKRIGLVPTTELESVPVPLMEETPGECKATTQAGSMCRRRRQIETARCHQHQHMGAQPMELRSRGGAEFVRISPTEEGLAEVIETHVIPVSNGRIADRLRMSAWEVEKTLRSAYQKIRAAIRRAEDRGEAA